MNLLKPEPESHNLSPTNVGLTHLYFFLPLKESPVTPLSITIQIRLRLKKLKSNKARPE
jgi:hypothetical protein